MLSSLLLTSGLALTTAAASTQYLGSASSYGVLGASTVTSTGATDIKGKVGCSPGTSITGFPPATADEIHSADADAATAQTDAHNGYTALAAMKPAKDMSGQDLGGKVLNAGVYSYSSSAGLTGVLTLDAQGDPNASFVIQIVSTLTTATASKVALINGARSCNVYWLVGSSGTLGTRTDFSGNVIAVTSITVNSDVIVKGGLYALNAAVTMIQDNITAQSSCPGAVVPGTSTTPVVSKTSTTPVVVKTSSSSTAKTSAPTTLQTITKTSASTTSSTKKTTEPTIIFPNFPVITTTVTKNGASCTPSTTTVASVTKTQTSTAWYTFTIRI